eukprot:TRINITY_DN23482_c0_g1_i1.p1 TRINITY_DN23482_c0_g1~~TRINITY_DN23482_c0_g1_i1.p1  ORF type:complete len:434 (-),score=48.44 TRINITY_DN23482_c0_g1_i1:223-1524(-)
MDPDTELENILWPRRSKPESDQRALSCIVKIQAAVAKFGPEWNVRAFGSFANGLCMEGSDLDATCYVPKDDDDESSAINSKDLLSRLKDALDSESDFAVVEFVSSARVPILRLRFDATLDVDLSCNNTEPFPNTQLLRAYSSLHPFVRDVILLVKCWAKGAGVVGAKDGHLSSYSFALMTIYFMQVDARIGLPCFDVSEFDGKLEIPESARRSWSPSSSRAAMLQMFFEFYAFAFNWGNEVVAMHVGQRTDSRAPVHTQLKDAREARLHIADPFLTHRNLNCVLKPVNEEWLYSQLQAAASEMRSGVLPGGLRGLLPRPHGYPDQMMPAQSSMQPMPGSGMPWHHPTPSPNGSRPWGTTFALAPRLAQAGWIDPVHNGGYSQPNNVGPGIEQKKSKKSATPKPSGHATYNDSRGTKNAPAVHEVPMTKLATFK